MGKFDAGPLRGPVVDLGGGPPSSEHPGGAQPLDLLAGGPQVGAASRCSSGSRATAFRGGLGPQRRRRHCLTRLGLPTRRPLVLRYRATEIDDGVNHTGPPCEARLDDFVNGEPVEDQDVVIWYGVHFTHDVKGEPPGDFGHIVGPTLRPVKW
jgi:hypothetical protein